MADDPGMMFPSLYQDDPGDQPAAADITGLPLPAMSEQDPAPLAPAPQNVPPPSFEMGDGSGPLLPGQPNTGGEHRFIEEGGQPLVSDPTTAVPAQPAQPQQTGPRRRTARERIGQLTQRYHAAQDENSELRNELAQVTQTLSTLQRQMLTGMQQPSAMPTPASAPQYGGLGLPESNPLSQPAPSSASPDIGAIVARAIDEKLTPLTQEIAQNRASSQLLDSHRASNREVIGEFPELADPRSPAGQLYQELYETSPLRALPDAPYQIALQVMGLLSDQRAVDTDVANRKRSAAVHVPHPQLPGQHDAARVATEDEKRRYITALKRYKAGIHDFNDYKTIRILREKFLPRKQ